MNKNKVSSLKNLLFFSPQSSNGRITHQPHWDHDPQIKNHSLRIFIIPELDEQRKNPKVAKVSSTLCLSIAVLPNMHKVFM